MDAKDHKRAVVLAAAVDLEGTARPFAERSPVLVAGSRSLEILHCQLRLELEEGGSPRQCHWTSVAKRSTRSSPPK